MGRDGSQTPALKGRKQSASTQCSNNSAPESSMPMRLDRIKTCRICLEEGSPKNDDNQIFIKPCKCSGSLEYVHESCLCQWINTMLEKKKEDGKKTSNIHCEICKEVLQYQIGKKLVCRDSTSRKMTIKNNKSFFILSLLMIFFFAIVMGALVFIKLKLLSTNISTVTSILIIIGFALVGIGFFMWIGKIIWSFCLKIRKEVIHIQPQSRIVELKLRSQKQNEQRNSDQMLRRQSGGVMVIVGKGNDQKARAERNQSFDPMSQQIQNPLQA